MASVRHTVNDDTDTVEKILRAIIVGASVFCWNSGYGRNKSPWNPPEIYKAA